MSLYPRTTSQGVWRGHPCCVTSPALPVTFQMNYFSSNSYCWICFEVSLHQASFPVHRYEMYKLLLFSLMQETPRARDTCRKSPSSVPGNRCNNKCVLNLLIFSSQDFKVLLVCSLWAIAGPASIRETSCMNSEVCDRKKLPKVFRGLRQPS